MYVTNQSHARNLSRNYYKTNCRSNKKVAYHTQLSCSENEEHEIFISNKLKQIKLNIQKNYESSIVNKQYCFPRRFKDDEEQSESDLFTPSTRKSSIYISHNLNYKLKDFSIKPKDHYRSNSRNIKDLVVISNNQKSRICDISSSKLENNSMLGRQNVLCPLMNKRKLVFHKRVLTRLFFQYPN